MERDTASRSRQDSTRSRRLFLQTVGAVGLGLVASTTASASEHDDPNDIDSCTVIDEPGEYELVADIEPAEVGDADEPPGQPEAATCIEIQASDVTLHGNGHTIDGHAAQDSDERRGHAIGVNTFFHHGSTDQRENVENVVIEDVHVTGFRTGVRFEAVSDGRIADVVARDNAEGIGFYYWASRIDVENNRLIENGTGFKTYGDPDVLGGPTNNAIDHNDIESNGTGVRLGHETRDHTFRHNRIIGNGNGVDHSAFTSENDYHYNAICGNESYGIHNSGIFLSDLIGEIDGDIRIEDVVNATENFWGATNGPSSYGDPAEPFTDPETGRPAEGNGDAISESLDPGVANVHFDPFLDSSPEDAGADL